MNNGCGVYDLLNPVRWTNSFSFPMHSNCKCPCISGWFFFYSDKWPFLQISMETNLAGYCTILWSLCPISLLLAFEYALLMHDVSILCQFQNSLADDVDFINLYLWRMWSCNISTILDWGLEWPTIQVWKKLHKSSCSRVLKLYMTFECNKINWMKRNLFQYSYWLLIFSRQ